MTPHKKPRPIQTPWFEIDRIESIDNPIQLCDLFLCIPPAPAHYWAKFKDGQTVYLCERHGLGVVGLAEYLSKPEEWLKK